MTLTTTPIDWGDAIERQGHFDVRILATLNAIRLAIREFPHLLPSVQSDEDLAIGLDALFDDSGWWFALAQAYHIPYLVADEERHAVIAYFEHAAERTEPADPFEGL